MRQTDEKPSLISSPPTPPPRCCTGWAAIGDTLRRLLDVTLFGSFTFWVLLLALFAWMLGLYVPYLFITGKFDRSLTQ